MVGFPVVVDITISVLVATGAGAAERGVALVVSPVATGPGRTGPGLACVAGFEASAATAANTVAITMPATARIA